MQIRAGNRQDEPIIRTIVFQALEALGIEPELDGRDKDLRNLELNYFWHDGLCIVAERDGQVIGVLAAARSEKQEDALALKRLAVTPGAQKRGAARKLIKTMCFFARNMEYKKVVFCLPGFSPEDLKIDPLILSKLGFEKEENTGNWQMVLGKAV